MVMFILVNNVTTDAESVLRINRPFIFHLTSLIEFCNINLYTNKCIDSKRPTASVPAPTLITNSMDRTIEETARSGISSVIPNNMIWLTRNLKNVVKEKMSSISTKKFCWLISRERRL
jgi:hypothetical protein